MLRTYVYIPDELEERIKSEVKVKRLSRAEVIRRALGEGIGDGVKRSASLEVLEKIRDIAKKNGDLGPRDGSSRMNDYLWGRVRHG